MFKVLISDNVAQECVDILQAEGEIEVDYKTNLSPEELKTHIGNYDALVVRSNTKVTGDLIALAHKLKVIGRAGAGTIAEITALGKPSILVPFPYAAHNHQFENAKILESSDATVLIEDKDATPEKFALTLTNLFDEDKLNIMAANAKKLGKPEAAREIVDDLYNLAGDN